MDSLSRLVTVTNTIVALEPPSTEQLANACNLACLAFEALLTDDVFTAALSENAGAGQARQGDRIVAAISSFERFLEIELEALAGAGLSELAVRQVGAWARDVRLH